MSSTISISFASKSDINISSSFNDTWNKSPNILPELCGTITILPTIPGS
jgi:hypothetical protein